VESIATTGKRGDQFFARWHQVPGRRQVGDFPSPLIRGEGGLLAKPRGLKMTLTTRKKRSRERPTGGKRKENILPWKGEVENASGTGGPLKSKTTKF